MTPPCGFDTWRAYERSLPDCEGRCAKCYGEMKPNLRQELDGRTPDEHEIVEWLGWSCGCGWYRATKTGDAV